jgi:hypothetical protein
VRSDGSQRDNVKRIVSGGGWRDIGTCGDIIFVSSEYDAGCVNTLLRQVKRRLDEKVFFFF